MMKFPIKLGIVGLGLCGLLGGMSVHADEDKSTWGFINGSYHVGAVQMVSKDFGSLGLEIQVYCKNTTEEIAKHTAQLVSAVEKIVSQETDFKLTTNQPELDVSPRDRYAVRYEDGDSRQLNPYYVDVCNTEDKDVPIVVGGDAIDLTKKSFIGSVELEIKTQNKLSDLTKLRQVLVAWADQTNEKGVANIWVKKEQIVVSAEKKDKELKSLRELARLGEVQSRLNVDEDFWGGFDDLSISSVISGSSGRISYQSIVPKLGLDGKSTVSVGYEFSIEFIPKDLRGEVEEVSVGAKKKGSLKQVVTGVANVDTDYYVAVLNFETSCHATGPLALDASEASFANFKAQAEAVVKAQPESPYERVEVSIGDPRGDGNWKSHQRKLIPAPNRNSRDRIEVISYINECDGSIYVGAKLPKDKITYSVAHKLTVLSKDLEGIQVIQGKFQAFAEAQSDSGRPDRVEARMDKISPRLQDAKLFEAVEILAYQSALATLISATGETSIQLLDEIQASEAYFTTKKVSTTLGRGRAAFENAPPMADGASAYKTVVSGENNIPMAHLRVDKLYDVRFRPKKDLIKILREERENTQTPPIPSIQPVKL